MNRLIVALVIVASMFMVTGCVTETVYYTPAYNANYVYSVGYNHSPYWNDDYYYGYDDLGDVGYWGMYDSYEVY